MNRVNWVDGRYTTPDDFNNPQIAAESQIENLAAATAGGHVSGCVPVGAGSGVNIGPGVAWDGTGRRIVIPAGGAPVDLSAVDRPGADQYRWLTWYATYRRTERGSMLDKAGVSMPAYLDDSFTLGVAQGPVFNAAGRNRRIASRNIAPRAPAPGGITLGYTLIDSGTSWEVLVTDETLYRSLAPRPIAPVVLAGLLTDVADSTLSDRLGAALSGGVRRWLFGAGSVKVRTNWFPIVFAAKDGTASRLFFVDGLGSVQPYGLQQNAGGVTAVLWAASDYGPEDPSGW